MMDAAQRIRDLEAATWNAVRLVRQIAQFTPFTADNIDDAVETMNSLREQAKRIVAVIDGKEAA